MRILIYGINYIPELTGIGKYTGELAEWLAQRKHHVEIITAMPYYPEWSINSNYRGKAWHTEIINKVMVHRTPLYIPKKITGFTRILHEFSFLINSQIHWLKTSAKDFDCIICISPPFHIGLPALFYGSLKRIPVFYHIQDLQIDAANGLKQINNKKLLNILYNLEQHILTKCYKVSSISEGMIRKIIAKGVPAEKIFSFPNWVDTTVIKPLPKKASLRASWGFSAQDKIILYAGNLGKKQGLDLLIKVADQLREQVLLHFVIVGEGGVKNDLIQEVKRLNLSNIHFYPLQPYNQLSALLATADLHLILEKKAASDLVMPSKLTSILAASGIALVTTEEGSSLYNIIQKHDLGIVVEPESIAALKESILNALQNDLTLLKANAQNYAQNHLLKEELLLRFENQIINEVLAFKNKKISIKSFVYNKLNSFLPK